MEKVIDENLFKFTPQMYFNILVSQAFNYQVNLKEANEIIADDLKKFYTRSRYGLYTKKINDKHEEYNISTHKNIKKSYFYLK